MRHLLTTLHARLATHALIAIAFGEECGEVCTPACRHEALRDRTQRRAQEIALCPFSVPSVPLLRSLSASHA